MVTAADGWFGWTLLVLGALAAATARNFAMGVNRLADRKFDAANPRTAGRPSVDGRVSAAQMQLFIVVNGVLFILISWLINDLALKLSVPFLIILGAYSFVKRVSPMAHLFLGLALGLAPVAGAVAVLGEVPMWSVLLALGVMFWVAGFDLLYALQDEEFDRKMGLFSVPSRYGAVRTKQIARLFHLLTILFWMAFVVSAGLNSLAMAAVLVAAVMLGAEHWLVRDGLEKINRAFFTINGYLGFVVLALVVMDVAWM